MIDRHHIVHEKTEYEARPQGLALRSEQMLIPRMYREVHVELHRHCPAVPLLGYYALTRTLQLFEPQSTVLRTLDNLQLSIEKAGRHHKAHPLETQLGELAVQALELQRPFLIEGMVKER